MHEEPLNQVVAADADVNVINGPNTREEILTASASFINRKASGPGGIIGGGYFFNAAEITAHFFWKLFKFNERVYRCIYSKTGRNQ